MSATPYIDGEYLYVCLACSCAMRHRWQVCSARCYDALRSNPPAESVTTSPASTDAAALVAAAGGAV